MSAIELLCKERHSRAMSVRSEYAMSGAAAGLPEELVAAVRDGATWRTIAEMVSAMEDDHHLRVGGELIDRLIGETGIAAEEFFDLRNPSGKTVGPTEVSDDTGTVAFVIAASALDQLIDPAQVTCADDYQHTYDDWCAYWGA